MYTNHRTRVRGISVSTRSAIEEALVGRNVSNSLISLAQYRVRTIQIWCFSILFVVCLGHGDGSSGVALSLFLLSKKLRSFDWAGCHDQ